eukprot:TRINITY_DN27168_c0_g1_i1.p1 TRINITY_DN27168_c0_g1~~TRINITY_DN27168_c0_g1_i1.p1  ORF type:complete len:522 (+),score=95.54 TRINITY_DN27168_c0_g1_i1:46-1566(+)
MEVPPSSPSLHHLAPRADAVVLQGYLRKLSPSRFKGYQRRWFVVKGRCLFYYRSREDFYRHAGYKGCIELDQVTRIVDELEKPALGFELHTILHRTFTLAAESAEDKRRWVDTLRSLATGEKRVTIFRNGFSTGGKVFLVHGSWNAFVGEVSHKLQLRVSRFFTREGGEIDSVEHILNGDLLYAAEKEERFLLPPPKERASDTLYRDLVKTVSETYTLSPRFGTPTGSRPASASLEPSSSFSSSPPGSLRASTTETSNLTEKIIHRVQLDLTGTPPDEALLDESSSEDEIEANVGKFLAKHTSYGPSVASTLDSSLVKESEEEDRSSRVPLRSTPVRLERGTTFALERDEGARGGRSVTFFGRDEDEEPEEPLPPANAALVALDREGLMEMDEGSAASLVSSSPHSSATGRKKSATFFVPPLQFKKPNKPSNRTSEPHESFNSDWMEEMDDDAKDSWCAILEEDFGDKWALLGITTDYRLYLRLVNRGLYLRFQSAEECLSPNPQI